MGFVDQFRDVVDLIRKSDNIELYQKILEFQATAMSLQEENANLREENLIFRRQAELDKSMIYSDRVYWRLDDNGERKLGPYCQKCWDGTRKLCRLDVNVRNANQLNCRVCGECYPPIGLGR